MLPKFVTPAIQRLRSLYNLGKKAGDDAVETQIYPACAQVPTMSGMSFVSELWSAYRVFTFYLVLGLTIGLTLDSEKQPWANFHFLLLGK